MKNYPIIYHGSENSLDIDAYILVDEILNNQEAKKLCESFPNINANLLKIQNGMVEWSYKGTEDECNNSILSTYHLHLQDYQCPITQKVDRLYGLKMIRTIRGLLSYCSRTEYRKEVKQALQSEDFQFKIEILKKIQLSKIDDFQKVSKIEVYKFFAFQLGQTLALLEDNVELFTKNKVAEYYPELKEYLNRKETNGDDLEKFYHRFISFIEDKLVLKKNAYESHFWGTIEKLNIKNETILYVERNHDFNHDKKKSLTHPN